MIGEWNCNIVNDLFGSGFKLYIYRVCRDGDPRGTTEIMAPGKDGLMRINRIKEGLHPDEIKPTLYLPRTVGAQLMKAIAESLDRAGVKTDSDAKIAGLLEATRAHLDDMRKIVFKEN